MTTRTRLCVIGDSHIGAIMRVWPSLSASFPDVDADFFPLTGGLSKFARIRGDRMVTGRKKIQDIWARTASTQSIDPAAYDAVVLVGFGTAAIAHALVLRKFALFGLAKPRRSVTALLSLPAFEALLRDRVRATFAFRTADWIRSGTTTPVFMIPTPRPTTYRFEEPRHRFLKRMIGGGEWAVLDSRFDAALRSAFGDLAVPILAQPEDTVEGTLSKLEFKAGRRVGKAYLKRNDDKDHVHLNEAYAEKLLTLHLPTVLAACRQRTDGAAAPA